jgi:hypothetical protein
VSTIHDSSLQDNKLVAKGQDFQLQGGTRPECKSEGSEHRNQRVKHGSGRTQHKAASAMIGMITKCLARKGDQIWRPHSWLLYHYFMEHRHLTHQRFTLAAIDDVIARGRQRDWAKLRQAALADRALLEKVLRVCQVHTADPRAQRYHFWKQYAERCLT